MTDQVVQILLHLEHKLSVTEEELDVCVLLTTLAALRHDVNEIDIQSQRNFEEQFVNVQTSARALDHDSERSMPSESVSTDQMLDLCNRVRASLTASIANRLPRTSTSALITIVSVFIRDRLECDDLVKAIDACIHNRAKALDSQRRATSTLNAASSALRALLYAYTNESNDLLTTSVTDEPASLRVDSLEATVAALDELINAHCSDPRVSKEPHPNAMELELSKLRELVEQYKRLDFKSGGSKQKTHRKRTRRSLSRLFPVLSPTVS